MIETGEGDLSFWDGSFWDLWLQKIFRNFASVKYQWMVILYIPTIYGMFNEGLTKGQPWISATLGLGFLGGGFITLALGRLMARTTLKEDHNINDVNIHSQSIRRGQGDNTIVMGDNVSPIDMSGPGPDPYYDSRNILDTDK